MAGSTKSPATKTAPSLTSMRTSPNCDLQTTRSSAGPSAAAESDANSGPWAGFMLILYTRTVFLSTSKASVMEFAEITCDLSTRVQTLGWSSAELASKAGCSEEQVAKVLAGREDATAAALHAVCAAVGCVLVVLPAPAARRLANSFDITEPAVRTKVQAALDGLKQSPNLHVALLLDIDGVLHAAGDSHIDDNDQMRELPTSKKLGHLLSMVGRVGMSWWWRNFSHGQHRGHELTVEGNLPAKARGRPMGWNPKPPR